MIPTTEHAITITRRFSAAISDVYAAWTVPTCMERWLGKVTAEVNVGGRYRFKSLEGNCRTHVYTGEYLSIEENHLVVQSFLAGEPNPNIPNPYSNEFIGIQVKQIDPELTELTFVNGWDGETLTKEFEFAVRAAWSEWLDRMQRSLTNASPTF